ncbi:MAG TPA: 4Fe-4S dicluster domain-containing protein [Phycisphaerae bacterium]|nr:4Fe-4S dicluster domain-containing protein [Phycisphaerae bacterium]
MSLFRRRPSFRGGYWFAQPHDVPGEPIGEISPTAPLAVPLADGSCPAASPVVEAGQAVAPGQLIARSQDQDGLPAHAPVSGNVIEIGRADTADACDVPAIVIEPDPVRRADAQSVGTPLPDRPGLDKLIERFEAAAVINTVDNEPLHQQLARARQRPIHHVIVNSIESQPPLVAQRRQLAERPTDVLDAAEMIGHAIGARRLWLAISNTAGGLVRSLQQRCGGRPTRLAALAPKYPQESPVILVHTLLGLAVPPGHNTLDAGVLVLDVGTALAAGRATRNGQPHTHRVLTVAGDAAERPGCYRVAVGTSLADVCEHVGLRGPLRRVVVGGVMTGLAVSDLHTVVTRTTSAVLFLSQSWCGRPIACVRCGACMDHCPVGLAPASLLSAFELDQADASELYPEACIECGVCSLVCPSHLPLLLAAQRLKARAGVRRAAEATSP